MQALKYARAASVDDAIRLLRDGGEAARVLAGGTDLIVQARERRREVHLLVDIKRLAETMVLAYHAPTPPDAPPGFYIYPGLEVGAAVPLYRVYGDPDVQRHYRALVEASHVIGGTAIQGRATLGGNLANASPAADSIPAMMALGGVARVVGAGGTREIPVAEFCTGPGRSALQPTEFIVSLYFPPPASRSGSAWERFIPRNEMDIAVVNAAAYLAFEGDTVSEARLALGAVAPTPLALPDVAAALVGRPLDDAAIDRASAAASAAARPISDMRGTEAQRRRLVGVLVGRVLRKAAARARGEEVPA
ncbi:MAG: xanthine dehydrogenase family protein subunit M [Dehalococcoidia bacterium]|nr:xanthine dehydrogenase family protein subunit M [Dehalococcoidia bacterium]